MSSDKEQVAQKKELVLQLRELVGFPSHQAALMENDACLASLQQHLTCPEVDIVLVTIEILYICAQTPKNGPRLAAVNNMIEMLDMLSTEHQDPKVRAKASELLSEISPEDDDLSKYLEEVETASRISKASRKSQFITKQLYMVHLRIGNVRSAAQRDKFYIDAVKHEMVLSATFDSRLRNATLYTTQANNKDELIKHLTRKGYDILSNDFGFSYRETEKLGLEDNEKEDTPEDDDVKSNGPAYLDRKSLNSTLRDDTYALGRYHPNLDTETLASRLDRFKQEQEDFKEKEASLLSNLTKWFW